MLGRECNKSNINIWNISKAINLHWKVTPVKELERCWHQPAAPTIPELAWTLNRGNETALGFSTKKDSIFLVLITAKSFLTLGH